MGIGGISWPQILIVLVIVLLIFGTKRIRNIGSDLGGAIREFRKGVGESDDDQSGSGNSNSQQKSSRRSDDKDESTSTRER